MKLGTWMLPCSALFLCMTTAQTLQGSDRIVGFLVYLPPNTSDEAVERIENEITSEV